jgi:hypothetical protein
MSATKKARNKYQRAQFNKMRNSRANIGYWMEDTVEKILETMVKDKKLLSFKRSKPNSRQDREGRDFRVTKLVQGQKISISFGITISLTGVIRHKCKHPDVPQLLMEPTISDERIAEKILSLFNPLENN